MVDFCGVYMILDKPWTVLCDGDAYLSAFGERAQNRSEIAVIALQAYMRVAAFGRGKTLQPERCVRSGFDQHRSGKKENGPHSHAHITTGAVHLFVMIAR